MEPGKTIIYFDKDKVTCGICLAKKGNRLHLISEHNREVNLTLSRVIHSSEKSSNLKLPKEDLLKELKTLVQKEEKLKESVNTEELWTLLQGEGEHFDLHYITEIAFGINPTSEQSLSVLRSLFADKVHFKFKAGKFRVHSPHQVQQILMKLQRDAERENDFEEGSSWFRKKWDDIPTEDPPRKNHYLSLLRELAIFGTDSPRYQEGKQLLQMANLNYPEAPFKLLVKMGEMEEDENLILPRYGISTQWTPEALGEAAQVSQNCTVRSPSSQNKRRDLTPLKVFSIDGDTTLDIDDALSIEASEMLHQVGIHITDVAHHITPESHLDREANERITSIYLPEGNIPMLPPILSEDVMSLVEGKDRLAISIIIYFDSSHEGMSNNGSRHWLEFGL